MFKKLVLTLALVVTVICLYASFKPDFFIFEKSEIINATPEKIFPYLESLKLGSKWEPFTEVDPNTLKEFSGPDSGIGAKHFFSGNSEVGEGTLEILNTIPNKTVEIKLAMTRPMNGESFIVYALEPIDSHTTKFTWSINGKQTFIGKLFSVFIDCETMMGRKFEKGITNLKRIVEENRT